MINERTRRKPEFSAASTPVRLADGGTWFFPKPWVEIRFRLDGGEPSLSPSRTTHGPDFDAAVEMIEKSESNAETILAVMVTGAFLLRKNYNLTDEELESLFIFRFADQSLAGESLEMLKQIADVAMGTGEKRFPAGSASP